MHKNEHEVKGYTHMKTTINKDIAKIGACIGDRELESFKQRA